jgi:hypothetical protein
MIFVVDVRMSWSRVKKVGGTDRLQVDRSRTFVFSGSMYRSSLIATDYSCVRRTNELFQLADYIPRSPIHPSSIPVQ